MVELHDLICSPIQQTTVASLRWIIFFIMNQSKQLLPDLHPYIHHPINHSFIHSSFIYLFI